MWNEVEWLMIRKEVFDIHVISATFLAHSSFTSPIKMRR